MRAPHKQGRQAGVVPVCGSDRMAVNSEHNQEDQARDQTNTAAEHPIPPPWASALRDLYQQVVEEPLPEALADLLARLDREDE